MNFCCGSETSGKGTVQDLVSIFFRVVAVVGVGCGSGGDEESSGGVDDLAQSSASSPSICPALLFCFDQHAQVYTNSLAQKQKTL